MKDHHTFENGLKYKPDYKWPESGSERNCPNLIIIWNWQKMYLITLVNLGGVINVNINFQEENFLI